MLEDQERVEERSARRDLAPVPDARERCVLERAVGDVLLADRLEEIHDGVSSIDPAPDGKRIDEDAHDRVGPLDRRVATRPGRAEDDIGRLTISAQEKCPRRLQQRVHRDAAAIRQRQQVGRGVRIDRSTVNAVIQPFGYRPLGMVNHQWC